MRLPIRARLTAWYAALLAAIMVALGGFLTLQLESDLEQDVEREVRAGSAQISLGYAKEGPADFRDVSRTVLPHGSSAAQVLSPDGRVLVAYGELLARRPIAPPGAFRDALNGKQSLVTVRLGPNEQRFRGIVSPVRRRGRDRVLVVAESLRHVEESVDQVLLLLLLAGPAALAATALGGWWLARKALLPVDRMTSQAEEIGIDRLHDRIALPPRARRDRAPCRDAERDAGPARAGSRGEAPDGRRRITRAADPAGGHARGAGRQPDGRRPPPRRP